MQGPKALDMLYAARGGIGRRLLQYARVAGWRERYAPLLPAVGVGSNTTLSSPA